MQSITILGGTVNVLNEDSHVVHHQYPGVHWTRHPSLLTKHESSYGKSLGSVFYGTHTFEVLALILMREYEKLADRFIGEMPSNAEAVLFGPYVDRHGVSKPTRPIPREEAAELLKARLRACWWGPRIQHARKELLDEKAGMSFARQKEWEMVDVASDNTSTASDGSDAGAPAASSTKSKKAATAKQPARSSRSPKRVKAE